MTPAPVGLRCPEHSGKPQGVRKVTSAAERAVTGSGSRRVGAVTMVLIGINVSVYLVELALGGNIEGRATGCTSTERCLQTVPTTSRASSSCRDRPEPWHPGATMAGVTHGEWWRLITAAFLHYGPIHLGLNMLALYWYGPCSST